ncbi:Pre-mRNA-processing factor 19 [Nibea albiflora]|uniref:Pre-mRNA-processing factor 19 n=1 Tax=Nibea albiflora TaxID=240163 RepID=A0ACB7EPR3_NIBAL|nr:Pre-mRNA-processing factor 19 [Nibea albiflora]
MLVLKEVTHADEGLYAIKLSSGFTYETYRLTVSECIKPYHRKYGQNFGNDITENSTILEFIPRGAPPEAMPVVLWNRTDPTTSNAGRGRLMHGKTWVAERVTQADQGNYTVRDDMGKIVSRSTLTVHGHSFNVTRFTKESLNLRLFLPIPHANLIFTPTRYPDESSLGPFDPKPPRGPVQLIREGQITDHDLRYRGLISLDRDGTTNAVVISSLTLRHGGLYEIRDQDGNLVSSTLLQVIEKGGKWRAHLKSITVPSGMFVSLVGVILFLKRYPRWSLRQIITGFRRNLSNEVPEHPCVSPVSNQVFERRLIEKYIAENGTDPMNGQPLSEEQLVDIKVSHPIRPKAPSATSIPAILKSLQDEWDAVMLHSFTLRQQLQTTRQELSHALYQHDAACRVIARLTKEVTAAREALATLKPQAGLVAPQAVPASQPAAAGAGGEPMEISEQVGMTPEIIQKLQDKATILTTERKKRGKTVPEELVRAEDLSKYRQVASHAGLHSASVPGILALDLCPSDTSKVLTGGADKNVVVFDKNEEQIVATLKGHTKKVTSVIYHPSQSVVFSASPDNTIRVWSVTGGNCVQVVRAHEAGVTGLSLHATGDYLLSSSEDQYWAFSDIQTGRVLTKVTDESAGCALTCAQFHPDGLIFGTGTADSQIKIWDLKERTNVANFPGHSGPVTSIAFSENGYYLATGAQDSSLKLWDLRKLKNFKTITLDNNYEVKSLVFDQSGTYLAVGGSDIRVYICKQWSEVLNFTDHTGLVTGVAFGENAQFLTSAGMDRSLKFYSL